MLGRTLKGATASWKIIRQLPRRRPGATGGTFSVGYIVEDAASRQAYLKALDLSVAALSPDPVRELQALTTAFNFERDLLERCRNQRLDRVVLAVDHGQVTVDPALYASLVPFIVFELAGRDVRAAMNAAQAFDVAWALRSLHQVATGLMQLHSRGIAHQDLKPSNVMLFEQGAGAKLGDLGRATQQGGTAPPHEHLRIAGDRTYAPPELLYGEIPADWNARRFGCDLYLLGSLVVSLVAGVSMTAMLTAALPSAQHWSVWRGTYATVLPFVRNAFDLAVTRLRPQFPAELAEDLERIVRQLCDPHPTLRGHPRARAVRHGNKFAVDRYVTELDLLARRAEQSLRGAQVTQRAVATGHGGKP